MANQNVVSYVIRRNGRTMERGRFSEEDSNTACLPASRGVCELAHRAGEGAVIHLRTITKLHDGRIVVSSGGVEVRGSDGWQILRDGTRRYTRAVAWQYLQTTHRGWPAKEWPEG